MHGTLGMDAPILWSPPPDARTASEVGRFMEWLEEHRGRAFADYDALLRWSIDELSAFWGAVWDFFDVRSSKPYEVVVTEDIMPGARWFPGARLNYAEHLFSAENDPGKVAIVAHSQSRPLTEMTFGELADQVARARAGLEGLGVRPGDRVAAYLPNIPETLIAFAATASLGAIWSSCAPELGTRGVIDRLTQLDPVVLLAVDGYGFRDRVIDRRDEVVTIRGCLPTLRHVIHVPFAGQELPNSTPWSDLVARSAPLAFEAVPFDHPLCVLFSSGTTGKPKAIVHGHGGILLEHLKSHAFSWDLKPGGRLLWFTTTSWMMWNALVSALLVRSSIVMIDGDPTWPDLDWQWGLAEQTRPTFMGASPTFLMACRKAGLRPGHQHDLSSIKVLGTAGSPLPAEGYRYVYEEIGRDILLINGSGGTDVCSGIVGGSPMLPVWEGEISGRLLGVATDAVDGSGHSIIDELGELVITRPMPSMPVGFWGDDDGSRYRDAYFTEFPGVWRHGDWIRFTDRGSCVVAGRSDATLNRGGVRLGTGEFYGALEDLPEVADSLVVHLEGDVGSAGELLLFVVLAGDAVLDDSLRDTIKRALRAQLSPRHVPDAIAAVPAIPMTLTGKKIEAPVKRILLGTPADTVVSRDALANPSALDAFIEMGAARANTAHTP